MAANNSPDDIIARPGGGKGGAEASSAGEAFKKFRGLPPKVQGGIILAALVVVFYLMSSMRGGSNAPQTRQQQVNLGRADQQSQSVSSTFTGIETDRPAVMQSVFEQNRRDMADLRSKIETDFASRDKALQDALGQNQELQRQMQQMMGDFTTELKNMQLERARDSERLGQLADQQKQMEMAAPVDGVGQVSGGGVQRRRAIQQVVLGGGALSAVKSPFEKLAGDATTATHMNASGQVVADPTQQEQPKLPFLPPLGFVHGVLLNGVDALTGGSATPALVRLSGTYKTAMNKTITLDGCIAMVEFEGNISTERATGKPVRMTCVYPDEGAATYSLSGYAVDAEDGIIGVPGVMYEGDPTRIAAAMMGEFAAGITQIVADSQSTNTVDSNGTQQSTITGSQAKAQVYGGASKALSSLSQYLQDRVTRVQSFIRLDATREINLVILNGTELRNSGGWSDLFDANSDAGTPPSTLKAGAAAAGAGGQ